MFIINSNKTEKKTLVVPGLLVLIGTMANARMPIMSNKFLR